MDDPHIVIFDGHCVFCNRAVNFIIRRDANARFAFAPMQSEFAQGLARAHGIDAPGVDTFILIKQGRCYIWSDAALEISKDLSGHWYLFNGFKIVPRLVRDFIYRQLARHRYRLMGKRDFCLPPDPDMRKRFID